MWNVNVHVFMMIYNFKDVLNVEWKKGDAKRQRLQIHLYQKLYAKSLLDIINLKRWYSRNGRNKVNVILNIGGRIYIIDKNEMATPAHYVKCAGCRCKYINDDEHVKQDVGYNRLDERYKTCF